MPSSQVLIATTVIYLAVLFWTFVVSKLISLFVGGGVSLVVQKLSIQKEGHEPVSAGIEIMGRREGLIAFLLTLIGLSPTTTLIVNTREAVCRTTGLLGIAHQSVPLDRVAQVTSGSKVAFEYIVGAVITGLIGLVLTIGVVLQFQVIAIFGVPMLTALFIGIAVGLYFLNKRFYVGVFPQGGWPMLLVFKPNVIEGVELNLERALEIAGIIRTLTVDSRQGPKESAEIRTGRQDQQPANSIPQPSSAQSDDGEQITPESLLHDAQHQIRAGQRDDAIATLRFLVRQFPDTTEATQAARSLARAGVSDA